MAQVNIRIDDALKEQGEKLFASLGMNFSTAISIFVSQSVREGGLPFAVTTKTDSCYSDNNMKGLRSSMAGLNAGRGFAGKTMDITEAMENEKNL